jgi:hypothetical protein
MPSVGEMSFKKWISLSQLDKMILTLATTCLLPLLVHTLPFFTAIHIGQQWLPIFYAPLIASLCFRPHVALIAGLCAPTINHVLFGVPEYHMSQLLTLQLLVFCGLFILIKKYWRVAGWHIIPIYIVTQLLVFFALGHLDFFKFGNYLLASLRISWPGLVTLILLTEAVNLFYKKHGL